MSDKIQQGRTEPMLRDASDALITQYYLDSMQQQLQKARTAHNAEIAQAFYEEVCAEAEANMLKTGKLEGSHFAAMQVILQRWKEQAND